MNLITKEEAIEVYSGQSRQEVEELNKKYDSEEVTEPTPEQFVFVRNYLILYKAIFNAHRSAIIYELMCQLLMKPLPLPTKSRC